VAVAFARHAAKAPRSSWCAVCVELLAVAGAGLTIMGGDHAGPICVSSPTVASLEDLQFETGEGPCADAFRTGLSVHASQLGPWESGQWPSFVGLAQERGICAVSAFPLTVDGAKVGVLSVYRDRAGELSELQQADGEAMAEVLAATVLRMQADAPAGALPADLDGAAMHRAEVYQASGMVAVQLQVSSAEALARIRAHAFASGRPLDVVASDVVARRLRLHDDHHRTEGDA
jgi:hypothetical protein